MNPKTTRAKNYIKIQTHLSLHESFLLRQEASIQKRTVSNLLRKWVSEKLERISRKQIQRPIKLI